MNGTAPWRSSKSLLPMSDISPSTPLCRRPMATKGRPISCGFVHRTAKLASKFSFTAKQAGPFLRGSISNHRKPIARAHRLDPAKTLFVQQSEIAIAAGAFHNDVVAVANERVLFTHEQAFEYPEETYAQIRALMPEAEIVVVPANRVSLADAIQSYLFNAQLVTLPNGGMALILPSEAQANANVWGWLSEMVAGNGPIRELVPVDVRQSMANGGGPACLRLRVVADPVTVDARFIADEAKLDRIAAVIAEYWPESISPEQLGRSGIGHAGPNCAGGFAGSVRTCRNSPNRRNPLQTAWPLTIVTPAFLQLARALLYFLLTYEKTRTPVPDQDQIGGFPHHLCARAWVR